MNASSTRIAGWSLFVSILALAVAAIQPGKEFYSKLTAASASISTPKSDEVLVGPDHKIGGRARDIPLGSDLWVVVRTTGIGDWYPSERVALPSPDGGDWSSEFSLGGPGKYQIFVYLADSQASGVLTEALNKMQQNGFTSGIVSLPAGVTVKATVTVTRSS
ncbi:hypothetical protein FKR81_32840 [Lentzea tibetensis]|uniref:Uncharacterized protein n=1 Tax=Lentzea tibetensis TaxID=2591470 RepID=A0A563EK71_9PSEU|nr:hypothetical protein [Lentzea tibetensis]TWP47247.1 hypothetical protein FKR81_32840 [Lentzea tibetensis]